MKSMQHWQRWIALTVALALIIGAWRQWLPYSLTETLGFVTGVWCVVLVVRESIWNFPVGIANSLFFLVLFLQARLFGDAGLQIVYLALGVQGWYNWLYGGEQRSQLKLARASLQTMLSLSGVIVIATVGLMLALRQAKGAAPL